MTAQEAKFTLIEMLIVIAIIGILAALLMPALQASLDTARAVQCANNIKCAGIISASFAGEHNGSIMPVDTYSPSDSKANGDFPNSQYGGAVHVGMLMGYNSGTPTTAWGYQPISSFNEIFSCPTDAAPLHFPKWKPKASDTSFLPAGRVGYSILSHAWSSLKGRGVRYGSNSMGGSNAFSHFLRPGDIRKPSETVYYGDCLNASSGQVGGWLTLSWGSTVAPDVYRHSTGSLIWGAATYSGLRLGHRNESGYNVMFFDNHVESFAFPDYSPSLTCSWLTKN